MEPKNSSVGVYYLFGWFWRVVEIENADKEKWHAVILKRKEYFQIHTWNQGFHFSLCVLSSFIKRLMKLLWKICVAWRCCHYKIIEWTFMLNKWSISFYFYFKNWVLNTVFIEIVALLEWYRFNRSTIFFLNWRNVSS